MSCFWPAESGVARGAELDAELEADGLEAV